jgi:DNA-directed RNA polymerase specialized sigma24 family protein
MRQIRDVLRLVLRDKVSRRATALSLSVPRTSVNDLVTRALAAELTWEVVNELDDAQLEVRLFRPVPHETTRPQPDFNFMKRELAVKGVTLVPRPDLPASASEIWELVRELSARQRQVIMLRHVADLPEAEIAGILGISRGTVSSTLRDAHRRLGRLLGDGNDS